MVGKYNMVNYERLGLISATRTEFGRINELLIRNGFSLLQEGNAAGLNWLEGNYLGKHIVLVRSGVGKVNAAAATQYIIDSFHPDIVIDMGIAGLLDQKIPAGSVIVTDTAQEWDTTSSMISPIESLENHTIVNQATTALPKKVVSGTIITGDTFITDSEQRDELMSKHDAVAVDMESAAIAKICHKNKLPFLVIKGFSDKANKKAESDLNKRIRLATERSFSVLKKLIQKKII